jgi:exopolyphosphatase/pppGpp-phosphohydrolase
MTTALANADAVAGASEWTLGAESASAPPGNYQAVIEIGTNSVKLLVAKPVESGPPAGRVALARLDEWVERLWRRSLDERRRLDGLPAERADTIRAGSVVLRQFMWRFGLRQFRFSARGVRYGALLDPPDRSMGSGMVCEAKRNQWS